MGREASCGVLNMFEPRMHALSDSFFLNSGASISVESNLASELSRVADQDCSTGLKDFERTKAAP